MSAKSSKPSIFDLKEQLAFYGAYHNDAKNIVIHTIFVPTIFFTALVFVASFGALFEFPFEIPALLAPYAIPNAALLFVLIYGLYYLILEPIAGFSFFVIMLGMWLGASHWYALQGSQAVTYAFGLHVVSWAFQFIGHGVFEGRKPALLDNLFQSLFLAPLFVWLHVLFVFGYRVPLQKELQKEVDQRIKTFKEKSKKAQ